MFLRNFSCIQITRPYNPEDRTVYSHCRENLEANLIKNLSAIVGLGDTKTTGYHVVTEAVVGAEFVCMRCRLIAINTKAVH